MKVQILGSGCPKCRALEENARNALESLGIDAEIEKVTSVDDIIDMGVLTTPAIAVDGDVKSSGKVLPPADIIELLRKAAAKKKQKE